MDDNLNFEKWKRISKTLDYILSQQTENPTKESPASYSIRGEPERPKRNPRKEKKGPPAEQLRMF
jgi:hypothetical protein